MLTLIKRAFLFVFLLLLVVLFWRLFSASRSSGSQMSYPAFLQALEAGKIQKATIYTGFDVANLQLIMRDSSNTTVDEVPTNDLPILINRMVNAGVLVEFGKARRFEWREFAFDNAPLVLLIVAVTYILYLRRRTKS